MKPECNNCRWNFKRYMDYYPCCDCIGLHKSASYNFFCFPDQLNMFGVAELCHCRSCGRRVHMEFGNRGYKYIRCKCGNTMQAKVTVEEMIRRWNNRTPARTKMWRTNKYER